MLASGPVVVADVVVRPAVVMLVGTSGSGKTTYRGRLLAAGLSPASVVSMDDLRREVRARYGARGRRSRPLQAYSAYAARTAARRCEAMAAFGTGYVADATHLVRRERRRHVAVAEAVGLPAVAVLTPLLTVDELVRRNAGRDPDERVPEEALLRQRHRRSLLSAAMLGGEGFVDVIEP